MRRNSEITTLNFLHYMYTEINSYYIRKYDVVLTPHNFMEFAQWKIPAKCFKICHIFGIRKPKYFFCLFFHFELLCNKSEVARNEKWKKKTIWVFLFQKCGKSWSILLEFFIKQTAWNCEVCTCSYIGTYQPKFHYPHSQNSKLSPKIQNTKYPK